MICTMRCFLQLGILLTVVLGCSQSQKSLDPDSYIKWIKHADIELSKHRRINGIDIRARYLPGEFLAYKEYLSSDSFSYDSLLNAYQCSLSFEVQLQADKADPLYGNLMYHNVTSAELFNQRNRFLNFEIQEFISLTCREVEYDPVLSHFEGYDPLGNAMRFRVVFVIPTYNCGNVLPQFGNMTLTFIDPYWKMGTVNFEFEKNSILSLPKLKL